MSPHRRITRTHLPGSNARLHSARWAWRFVVLLLIACFGAAPAYSQITDEDVASMDLGTPSISPISAQSGTPFWKELIRLGGSLIVVCALIYGVAKLAKKYLPAQTGVGRGGPIEILSVRSIGARKNLLLVRVQDKTLLIGVTPQNLQFIANIDEGEGAWDDAELQANLGDVTVAAREAR